MTKIGIISDSLIVIMSILGQINETKQIEPLVADIRSFVSRIRNINFSPL